MLSDPTTTSSLADEWIAYLHLHRSNFTKFTIPSLRGLYARAIKSLLQAAGGTVVVVLVVVVVVIIVVIVVVVVIIVVVVKVGGVGLVAWS